MIRSVGFRLRILRYGESASEESIVQNAARRRPSFGTHVLAISGEQALFVKRKRRRCSDPIIRRKLAIGQWGRRRQRSGNDERLAQALQPAHRAEDCWRYV